MKINRAEVLELHNEGGGWYVVIEMGSTDNQAEYTSKNFNSEYNAQQHLKGMVQIFEWVGVRETNTIIKFMPEINIGKEEEA